MLEAAESLTVVICIDHASVTGGLAKVAIESALGLKRHGVRPIVFSAVPPIDKRLCEAGIEVVCLGQHDILTNRSRAAAALQGVWNRRAAATLRDLLARLSKSETIVHVHGWAKALSASIAEPIRASGLPSVYTMHDYFLHCPNGSFYNYQQNAVCHLAPLSAPCWAMNCDSRNFRHKLWRNARLFITQHYARLAEIFTAFILLSDTEQEVVAPYLRGGAAIHRVCNPIDVEALGHKTEPTSGEIVFVGRLSPEKGAVLFAQAAERAGVTPIFIGDGRLAEELSQCHPKVRLLGWQAPHATLKAIRAARALVYPSVWYETHALAVYESLAVGTPVIVSDLCAGRETVRHGENGLWFKSGNVDALAGALRQLKDDALVTRMSKNAYNSYWSNPLTVDRHVCETLAVYRELLMRKPAIAAPRLMAGNQKAKARVFQQEDDESLGQVGLTKI